MGADHQPSSRASHARRRRVTRSHAGDGRVSEHPRRRRLEMSRATRTADSAPRHPKTDRMGKAGCLRVQLTMWRANEPTPRRGHALSGRDAIESLLPFMPIAPGNQLLTEPTEHVHCDGAPSAVRVGR